MIKLKNLSDNVTISIGRHIDAKLTYCVVIFCCLSEYWMSRYGLEMNVCGKLHAGHWFSETVYVGGLESRGVHVCELFIVLVDGLIMNC